MHIIGRHMIRLLSGQLSAGEERDAKEHLLSCDDCRREYEILRSVTDGGEAHVEPSSRVRDGILEAWDRASAVNKPPVRLPMRFRPAVLVSAAAAICGVIAGAYILLSPVQDKNASQLVLSSVSGTVTVDGSPAVPGSHLSVSSRIETGSDGAAIAGCEGYSVKLSASTRIALSSGENGAGVNGIIEQGTIVSSSDGRISYAYEVFGYRIVPKGTVFSVSAIAPSVTVCVRSGAVSVTDSGGRECAVIQEGSKWTSADNSVSAMGAADSGLFAPAAKSAALKTEPASSDAGADTSVNRGSLPAEKPAQIRDRDDLKKERNEIEKDRSEMKTEQKELRKMKRKGRE